MTEPLPPPTERVPVVRWLKRNLFDSWFSTLLTLAALTLIATVLHGLGRWAFTTAQLSLIHI